MTSRINRLNKPKLLDPIKQELDDYSSANVSISDETSQESHKSGMNMIDAFEETPDITAT